MTQTSIGPALTPASCFLTLPSLETCEIPSVAPWTGVAPVLLLTGTYTDVTPVIFLYNGLPLHLEFLFDVCSLFYRLPFILHSASLVWAILP